MRNDSAESIRTVCLVSAKLSGSEDVIYGLPFQLRTAAHLQRVPLRDGAAVAMMIRTLFLIGNL